MTHRHSVWAAAATVLVVAVGLLGACTSSEPEPNAPTTPPPTSTSAPPTVSVSPTPTADPEVEAAKAAVLEVYQRYWDIMVAAFADPTARIDPDLEVVAIDKGYTGVTSGVLALRKDGIEMVGAPGLEPEVTEIVPGESATIVDCVDSSDWTPQVAETGESAQVPGLAPRVVSTSQVTFYDGRWTISASATDRETTC